MTELTYERGFADGEDTGRENAKQAIEKLFPQTYGSYEQGLTDALTAIDDLHAAEPKTDPVAAERERIITQIERRICFDALADEDGRCSHHGGKCYDLRELINKLKRGML